MTQDAPIRADDVRRAAEQARGHEKAEALGALAFDVLSRQAEGRTLFAGKEHVQARAEAHDVDREGADTELGNLLQVLERGPEGPKERALVVAFALRGLAHRLGQAREDGAETRPEEMARRFVRHADWLEVATPHAVYALVDEVLDEADAAAVWSAVADVTLEEARGASAARHGARGRSAARLSALSASDAETAAKALGRIAAEAEDRPTRELARALGGASEGEPDAGRTAVHGTLRSARTTTRRTLRIVSGIAALGWLVRGLGFLVGLRRAGTLEVVSGGIRLRESLTFLGRTIRESEQTYAWSALGGVTRHVRYPAIHLLVGLVALSVGVFFGGLLAVEGVRSGETYLLLLGALAILLGAGLDLALDVLVPGGKGRIAVDVEVLDGRTLRLERVAESDADRFVDALSRRLVEG